MNYETDYRRALQACATRYSVMADLDLLPFVLEFQSKLWEYPIPKLCRWLGYIQGVLVERGITTVDAERDWTRPLFRPLDFA